MALAVQIAPSAELEFIGKGIKFVHNYRQRKERVKDKITSVEKSARYYGHFIDQSEGLDRSLSAPAAKEAVEDMDNTVKKAHEGVEKLRERFENPCSLLGRGKHAIKNSFGGFDLAEQQLEILENDLRRVFRRGQSVGAFERLYEVIDSLPKFFVPPQQVREELLEFLKAGRESVVVLNGMFGMGKSALALHAALTLKNGEHFPGGVFMLHFGEEYTRRCSTAKLDTKILQELKTLCCYLGHNPTAYGQIMSETVANMRSLLKRILPKKCLIVLDDVWSDRIVQAFLFEGHEGKLLVTAREHIWSAGKSIKLLPEHYQEGHRDRTMLAIYASGMHDVTSIESIFEERGKSVLKKCQGCPLLISIVGGILNNQRIVEWEKAAEGLYPEEWEKADKGLEQYAKIVVNKFSAYCEKSPPANGYPFTLFEAVQESVNTLSEDHVLVFRTFDIFAPSIPLPGHLVEFALFCKARHLHNKFEPCMAGLVGASLIERNFEGHYLVHSIVAEYLKQTYKSVGNILLKDCLEEDENVTRQKAVLAIYLLSYGNSASSQDARKMLKLKDSLVADGTKMEVPSEKSTLWEMSEVEARSGTLNASAKIRLGLHDRTAALEEFDPDQDIGAASSSRGGLKINLQDLEGAIDDLHNANELEPDNTSTSGSRRARPALHMLGGADAALKEANRARSVDVKNAYALSARGAVKILVEDFDGAWEDLKEAKKLNPDDPFTISLLEELTIHVRDPVGAIGDLNNAAVLEPNDASTSGSRADAGRLAKRKLDRCLRLRPRHRALKIDAAYYFT